MNMLGNDKGGRLTALIVGILGVVNPPHANILYRLKRRMAVIEYWDSKSSAWGTPSLFCHFSYIFTAALAR